MAGRFVRSSKYRHVFGRPSRKEQCYDNLRISKNAWDSNIIKANPKYLSVNWEAGGGGAFAVIPLAEKGKAPEQIPLFRGHTAPVLDTDWNPFNDSVVASGSDDGKVFVWTVPEGFTLHSEDDEVQDVSPVAKLSGHTRKVGHVLFNPSAENILASSSGDFTIKIWDVEKQANALTLKHNDIFQSLSFSANGSLLVTTSRDKKLRIWDVREEKPVMEVAGHSGAKNSRAVWMGEHDRIATTGFSRMSERQLGLWDIRGATEPINGFHSLDSISSICMPFWDDSTQCLYLAGKGDGNIRYFEYQNDKFEFLSEYKSGDAQRGFAFIPKRGVNLQENEVMRGFKTVSDTYIEPVSFIVPRRAEVFQSDIYPPCVGYESGLSAADWLGGKNALPAKLDMEALYNGDSTVHATAKSFQTAAAPAPAPAAAPKKEEPKPAPAPAPAPAAAPTSRSAPSSIKDSSVSMAAAASKFADDSDEEPEKDDGAFDEPPTRTAAPAAKPLPVLEAKAPFIEKAPTVKEVEKAAPAPSSSQKTAAPPSQESSRTAGKDVISSSLSEIKSLLEEQTKIISAQNEKISQLTQEVDHLKMKVDSGKSNERIRELELELEAARS